MSKLRLFAAALACMCSAAFAATPGTSLDGYRFERAEIEQRTVTLHFVPVENQTDMQALAQINGIHLHSGTVKAFAIYRAGSCTIYATDPKVAYEPEFLGHELAHCIYGNFHPEEDKSIK